jgi:phage-related protein
MAEAPTMEVRARLTAETAQFTRGFQQATQAAEGFSKTANRLRGSMLGIGVAAGAAGVAIISLGLKSFNAAARVDELDIAMNAVGKSTGLGYQAIRDSTDAIKANGIEMEIAQKAALKFAQNNINLTQASELARVAQDLAVISGMNSSDTFNMLTHAVITGRSEVLKSVGIQKSAGQMYESFAKSIGKTASQLTYTEKQTAVLNGALAEGAKVAGTYEAAMTSPGKVLRSFARVQNEISVSIGKVLLAGFGPLIFSAYNLVKALAKASEKSKTVQAVFEAMKMVLTKLTAPFVSLIDKITLFIGELDKSTKYTGAFLETTNKTITPVRKLAESFETLLPVIAAAGAGFATFAGRDLLRNLPILGNFLQGLKVFPVVMVTLALTSTQVRKALANLLSAFKPLLPVIVQIGKVMATASTIGVAVLAKAINILASIVRGILRFFQQNIAVIKTLGVVLAVVASGFLIYRGYLIAAGIAQAIFTAYTAVMTLVMVQAGTAMKAFNMILALNPILKVALLIGTLITAFVYLMQTNETFAKVVANVFNFVLKTVVGAFASIVNAIGMFVKGISYLIKVIRFFAEVVAKVFEFVIDVILTFASIFLQSAKSVIDGFISLMETNSIFAQVVENVFNFVIKSILMAVRFILTLFKTWIDFYLNVFDSQNLLYKVVTSVFNAIIKVIGFVITSIINVFAELVGGVGTLVNTFNRLFNVVKSVFLKLLDVIQNVGVGIFGLLNTISDGIGKFLGWVFDKMTAWLRALANLFSKIPKIGDDVAKAINSGLDTTKKAVTGFATGMTGLGEKMFEGIIKGATNLVNGVATVGVETKKALDVTEDTLRKFSATVSEFSDKDFAGKAIDTLIDGGKKVSETLGTVIDSIKDAEQINFGKAIIDTLVKGATGASSALGVVIEGMEKVQEFDMARTVGKFIDGIAKKVDKAGEFVLGLSAQIMEFANETDFASIVGTKIGGFIDKIKDSLKEGLGFGDILKEEEKKYNEASKLDDGTKAAEDAEKMANRLKTIRDAMKQGIESIKGVLDDLQQAAKDFADSLKDTIVGFAGLKSIELPDGFIPKAKSLITNMEQRLNKSKEFAGQISKLQSMGLDADALKSIIEEGPIKGAQLAASILGGGQSAIDEVSRLQKEIAFTGAVIGEYGARVGFDQKIATASTQLRDLQNAELRIPTSNANSTFIQQGAFQVFVDTSGAENEEERASIITREIEKTFAVLARQLASK